MNTLKELFEDYSINLEKIHENRKLIKKRLDLNRDLQNSVSGLKKKMETIVVDQMEQGKSLYEICIAEFGSIDKRFHVLFTLVGRK